MNNRYSTILSDSSVIDSLQPAGQEPVQAYAIERPQMKTTPPTLVHWVRKAPDYALHSPPLPSLSSASLPLPSPSPSWDDTAENHGSALFSCRQPVRNSAREIFTEKKLIANLERLNVLGQFIYVSDCSCCQAKLQF